MPKPAVTVRAIVVVEVSEPEVPVMVTVDVPTLAMALAVNVSTLELPDEAGLKVAVTPLGNPVAANDTLPVNGLTSVTVTVSVPLAPWLIDRADAEGLSVKLPFGAPQVVPFIANDVGTALVVPFQVPLNPMPEIVLPTATLPL